ACEVGLGGRLDATNVLMPEAAAITTIGLDHERYLGASLSAIAFEKAGVIKPSIPVVIGPLAQEPRAVIRTVAEERGAPLVDALDGCEVSLDPMPGAAAAPNRFGLRTPRRDYGDLTLALAGDHQIANAVVAVRLLETLDQRGVPVSAPAIATGLAEVVWPG